MRFYELLDVFTPVKFLVIFHFFIFLVKKLPRNTIFIEVRTSLFVNSIDSTNRNLRSIRSITGNNDSSQKTYSVVVLSVGVLTSVIRFVTSRQLIVKMQSVAEFHGSIKLFGVNDKWLTSLLSYLDIRSIGYFDIALSDSHDRPIYLAGLQKMNPKIINHHEHCQSSLKWVTKRQICATKIQMKEINDLQSEELFDGFICPSVTSIDLHKCQSIVSKMIKHLKRACPLIRDINLSTCFGVNKVITKALTKAFPTVTKIDISHNFKIKDLFVTIIAQGCPQLSSINLAGCYNVTDIGVLSLAWVCSLLTYINLSGEVRSISIVPLILLSSLCDEL